MFFAKDDTICNDTTELSVVEFNNILSTAFVVSALKPQEGSIQSRKPVKPKEVLEQLECRKLMLLPATSSCQSSSSPYFFICSSEISGKEKYLFGK